MSGYFDNENTVNFKVKRLTKTISQSLEAALFGAVDYETSYKSVIQPSLNGSVVVKGGLDFYVSEVNNYNERVAFIHSNGANTDIIEITCNEIEYPTFLKACQFELLKINNFRIRLVENFGVVNLSQFSEKIEVVNRDCFGRVKRESISVIAFKQPNQFQKGIIDIPLNTIIDKETSIINSLSPIQRPEGFSVDYTITSFVKQYKKA